MPKARPRSSGKAKPRTPRERPPARASTPRAKAPPANRSSGAELLTPTMRARELFWSNVVREILMSLWAASERPSSPTPEKDSPETPAAAAHAANLLDGRFSVVTNTGLRVPIAQVQPVFGCGVLGKQHREQWLSQAVECTVFQIRTPQGEVFTLPVHAVRAFHSLSEESMDQLGRSGTQGEEDGPEAPFGFAAYTSLARSASTTPDESDIDPRWIHASE